MGSNQKGAVVEKLAVFFAVGKSKTLRVLSVQLHIRPDCFWVRSIGTVPRVVWMLSSFLAATRSR